MSTSSQISTDSFSATVGHTLAGLQSCIGGYLAGYQDGPGSINAHQVTLNETARINVTFQDVPTNLDGFGPPFNVTQIVYHGDEQYCVGSGFGLENNTINDFWFEWDVQPVKYTMGPDGNSSDLLSFGDFLLPFWVSANYTVANVSHTTSDGGGGLSTCPSNGIAPLIAAFTAGLLVLTSSLW